MSPATTAIDETAAISEVPRRIIAAWAANDADAFAEVFAEDATMILPGAFSTGREEIRAYMGAAYSGPYKGTRVTGRPVSAKVLGPATAVLVTQGGVLTGEESEPAAEQAIRATWVLAKIDGQWLITAYQNTPVGA
jgi:uncharacterized protein (TIGR02246 family)